MMLSWSMVVVRCVDLAYIRFAVEPARRKVCVTGLWVTMSVKTT